MSWIKFGITTAVIATAAFTSERRHVNAERKAKVDGLVDGLERGSVGIGEVPADLLASVLDERSRRNRRALAAAYEAQARALREGRATFLVIEQPSS